MRYTGHFSTGGKNVQHLSISLNVTLLAWNKVSNSHGLFPGLQGLIFQPHVVGAFFTVLISNTLTSKKERSYFHPTIHVHIFFPPFFQKCFTYHAVFFSYLNNLISFLFVPTFPFTLKYSREFVFFPVGRLINSGNIMTYHHHVGEDHSPSRVEKGSLLFYNSFKNQSIAEVEFKMPYKAFS